MSNSLFSLIDSIVSHEIVYSGDYKYAEHLLEKQEIRSDILAEIFFLLGNRFFSAKQKKAAEMAWKKSKTIFLENKLSSNVKPYIPLNIKKIFMQLTCSILGIFFCIYTFLFVFYKREPLNPQYVFGKLNSSEFSFWDEWWDTGRPVKKSFRREFHSDELWPLINRTFEKIFGVKAKEPNNDFHEKLKRWLELSRQPKFGDGPTDYYALIARGLFEAREFEEALLTLKDSIFFAEKPNEFEKIYRDLGTVYYYRGYRLQPDGLAKYDINDVKDSVRSYEMAISFGDDPYLFGNLGWGYYLLGDFNSSIKNSLKALTLNPGLNYVRMNLGIAYLKTGDYELSSSAYSSILEHNPRHDEYEGGIRDLMELQMEYPKLYPFTNFVMGQLYWQQGLYQKSQLALQKFISQKFPLIIWKERARLLLKKMIEE